MSINSVKFAHMISYVTMLMQRGGGCLTDMEVQDFHSIVNEMMPAPQHNYASMEAVNELLSSIKDKEHFIPAIKAYRALTGADLKSAKDAVEKYR